MRRPWPGSLEGPRPERVSVEIRHREPVTPSEELSDVEVAVDRDRRSSDGRGAGEARSRIARSQPRSRAPSSPSIDESASSRSSTVRRHHAATMSSDAAALGAGSTSVGVASETWSRAVIAPSAAAGSIASIGSVIERALEQLDVPVPSVPCPGEVRRDRSDRRDAVGVLPSRVPERRRHLLETRGHEMGGEHHGPLVARSRPDEPLHERPRHPPRSTRSTDPPRSVAPRSTSRSCPAVGRRTRHVHPPSRSGRGAPPRRRRPPRPDGSLRRPPRRRTRADPAEPRAGGPSDPGEVERVQHRRRTGRFLLVHLPGGPAGTPTGARTPPGLELTRWSRRSDTSRSLGTSLPSTISLLFPTATRPFGGCAGGYRCTTIDLPHTQVRVREAAMRQRIQQRHDGCVQRAGLPSSSMSRRFHAEEWRIGGRVRAHLAGPGHLRIRHHRLRARVHADADHPRSPA